MRPWLSTMPVLGECKPAVARTAGSSREHCRAVSSLQSETPLRTACVCRASIFSCWSSVWQTMSFPSCRWGMPCFFAYMYTAVCAGLQLCGQNEGVGPRKDRACHRCRKPVCRHRFQASGHTRQGDPT